MSKYTNDELDKLFAKLKQNVKDEGLYTQKFSRVIFEFTIIILTFLFGVYSVSHFSPIFTVLLLTFSMMRSALTAHDLLHGQYFSNRKLNVNLSYLFANVITGMSSSWWAYDHNSLHHVFPIVINKDSNTEAAGGVFRGEYNYPKWFHKYQHILFWPLFILTYYKYVKVSFNYTIKNKNWGELCLQLVHMILPVYIISELGWEIGLATVFSIYTLWGVWFSAIFVTNHMGLKMLTEEEYQDLTWFELQTITSRNVRGGKFIHWIYGGLNTQIEHHLYPNLSVFKLLKAAEITERFCIEHEMIYHAVSPWNAYKEIYDFLKENRLK